MKNKKRRTIILLVLILLGISIGFAVLTAVLYINGNGLVKGNTWSVYWSNAEVVEGSVSTTAPVIGEDQGDPVNTKVTWSATFTEPGQYYAFTIDATNAGTIDAIIKNIEVTATPALPSYVNYRVTYADGGTPKDNDILPKGVKSGSTITPTTKKYKVVVEFDENISPEDYNNIPEGGETYTFDLDVPYDQETSEEVVGYSGKVELKANNEKLKGKTDTQLAELYGEKVTGFSTIYPLEWQLFYSDEDNVYLITKDYVRSKYLPKELYEYAEDTASNPNYRADFGCAVMEDGYQYTDGDILHSEPWKAGSQSPAIQNNPLKDKYLKWVNAYPDSKSANVIATAYMMDTSIWANFAGNAEGAYAMGGPTIEMWVLSFNTKHNNYYKTYDTIVPETNARPTGYILQRSGDETQVEFPVEDSMWSIEDMTKAEYYWLASPYAYNSWYTPTTDHDLWGIGGTNGTTIWPTGMQDDIQCLTDAHPTKVGFRPLVAIPKSSLK